MLNLLRQNRHTRPAIVRPQSIIKSQRNTTRTGRRPCETRPQIRRIAHGHLIHTNTDDQKASGQFSVREQIVDLQVQLGADQVYVRDDTHQHHSQQLDNGCVIALVQALEADCGAERLNRVLGARQNDNRTDGRL